MKHVLAASALFLGCYAHGAGTPVASSADPTAPPPAFRYEMCPADPLGPWTAWPCPFSSYGPQQEIKR